MFEYLSSLANASEMAFLSAFLLGLLTAISPCPLATNITATAYISRNIQDSKKVFWSGIIYTFGRATSYSLIGMVLFFGASKFQIARFFSQYGERFLGPILILIGLIMLNVIRLSFLGKSNFQEKFSERFKDNGYLGSYLLGVIFALAFCPYSGALFFGVLIPLTIAEASGLYLPLIFAVGTGLPVIFFAYLLAFSVGKIGVYYSKIQRLEKIIRYIIGSIFLLVGLYFVILFIT
ncbi:MAG: aromatic aminobenezylarsenical efflux permease ArsG family transporter [Crocinitomicaceae bacterium]